MEDSTAATIWENGNSFSCEVDKPGNNVLYHYGNPAWGDPAIGVAGDGTHIAGHGGAGNPEIACCSQGGGVTIPAAAAAAPVCIRPDVPVHVLRGVSVETVKVGRLNVGDVVIGEGKTSAVKRVEHFSVDDEACVVPKDLCGGFDDNVVVSKSHAVRCQTWPTNTWTFCQPDWERVTTTEYVHVELESYLDDHLLSGSIVLESWDGYARETDSIEDACSTLGCPWPHKWSSTDDNRWTRVDLRATVHDASPRLRQIRPL